MCCQQHALALIYHHALCAARGRKPLEQGAYKPAFSRCCWTSDQAQAMGRSQRFADLQIATAITDSVVVCEQAHTAAMYAASGHTWTASCG